MPRLGPPLRDYVPQVAIAELDDPEAIGPHYDELRNEALESEVGERRDHGRADVEACIRNWSGCKPGEARLSERV